MASEDETSGIRSASNQEDLEDDELNALEESQNFLADQAEQRQNFTLRGTLVGLAIGVIICFSNTYFGLQTGWISGMTMPASLIGFALFKSISKHLHYPFTPVENVLVQTVASAVGTMPLGCGFVGVIPALNYLLKPEENGPMQMSAMKLILWSLGICFFGVVFAVPLRKQVIIREKLKFPSGTATALVISVLHGSGDGEKIAQHEGGPKAARQTSADILRSRNRSQDLLRRSSSMSGIPRDAGGNFQAVPTMSNATEINEPGQVHGKGEDWKSEVRLLLVAFGISAIYVCLPHFRTPTYYMLILLDPFLVLYPPTSSSSNLRTTPSQRLAMDNEPITCIRRTRYHHGSCNNAAYAFGSNSRMGHVVSSSQA